jgi:hypothetical protein
LQDAFQLLPIVKVRNEESIQVLPKHLLQNLNPIFVLGIPEFDMHPKRSNRRIPEFLDTTLNLPERVGHVVMKRLEGVVLCTDEILGLLIGLCDELNEILLSLSQFLVGNVLVSDLLLDIPDGDFAVADASFPVFELRG